MAEHVERCSSCGGETNRLPFVGCMDHWQHRFCRLQWDDLFNMPRNRETPHGS